MVEKVFRAMGCRVNILLEPDAADSHRLLDQVPVWFEEWEQALSRFRPESELSMINHSAGTRVRVSDAFWQVLQISIEKESASDGLITPAVLPAMEAIGYTHSFASGIPEKTLSTMVHDGPVTDISSIQLFPESREIKLPAGMRLDFGGTAKGWAAHQCMLRLAEFGPVLVNAGGDISISGLHTDGSAWQVGIIDPLQPAIDLVRLNVGRSGVATSGKDYRKWLQDGILRHHIIDPRTGLPAETDILSASVLAPTAMEAEMAAKVIFILGSEDGAAWLQKQPQLGSLVVLDDGEVLISQTLKMYLGG